MQSIGQHVFTKNGSFVAIASTDVQHPFRNLIVA